jgi:hypothetical protein
VTVVVGAVPPEETTAGPREGEAVDGLCRLFLKSTSSPSGFVILTALLFFGWRMKFEVAGPGLGLA